MNTKTTLAQAFAPGTMLTLQEIADLLGRDRKTVKSGTLLVMIMMQVLFCR